MNEPLEKGDRVMLLHMEDKYAFISPGTWGTVRGVSDFNGIKQYNMTWDDGTKDNPGKVISNLGLLSDVDMWTTKEIRKKTAESYQITKKKLVESNLWLEKQWIKKINKHIKYL